MSFNLTAYALRLYREGHVPADFANLTPGLVVVSPIRPPKVVTTGGLLAPDAAIGIPGQFALSHKVEAVTADAAQHPLQLKVGDIVKCREEHLGLVDTKGDLLVIDQRHVYSVIARATDRLEQVDDKAA